MQLNSELDIYRWFMPMLLHVDFMHITFNLLSQLIIGGFIERIFGFWRTFGIYVISGIGGTLLGCLINDKISAGASGAIFGICSALVLLYLTIDWLANC
jgi:rhomboid protease GluP